MSEDNIILAHQAAPPNKATRLLLCLIPTRYRTGCRSYIQWQYILFTLSAVGSVATVALVVLGKKALALWFFVAFMLFLGALFVRAFSKWR